MRTEEAVEILLVEDNPNDVELTLHALSESQLANRIHVARDGEEALAFLAGDTSEAGPVPRVILLDIKLPKLSGLEVLERIRSAPRTRDVPVVMLTSSREAPDVKAAYELGANSYIVKPVDFDQFANAVREIGLYWLLLNEPPE